MAQLTFPTPTLLSNLSDPVANTDGSTKQYVDNTAANVANTAISNTAVLKTGSTITGIINISNTTNSISNSSGALIISGGVGIAGNVYTTSIYANNFYGTVDGGDF